MRIVIAKKDFSEAFMDLSAIGKNHCEFIEEKFPKFVIVDKGEVDFFGCLLSDENALLHFVSSEKEINSILKQKLAYGIRIEFPLSFGSIIAKFDVYAKYENKKHEKYRNYHVIEVSDENLKIKSGGLLQIAKNLF
jgi:hypothetical protein